ncbi:MAG: PT domain-containing protein [Clostridia bacterium]|nr:PT domain-containing protein [Clostridia bacterium]
MRRLLLLLAAMALAASGCVNREPDNNKSAAIPTQQLTEQPTPEPTEQPTQEPTQEPTLQPPEEQFKYEDVINIKNKVHRIVDGIEPYSLKDAYGFSPSIAFVVARVLSIKYYFGWEEDDFFDGWTTVEALVLEVKDEFNSAGVKPGDVLMLREDSKICFEKKEDRYDFFSEHHNAAITNYEEFEALTNEVGGFFQVLPKEGVDYILSLWPDEYPLIVGERYAMFCCMSDETTEYGMPESFLFYVYPMDRWIDLEGLVSNYGFDLCDEYITVSKQLAALFRHTEHIGESMIK